MNPYQELGIAPGASKEEVERAYRTLAFRWHPDRCTDLGAEDKMKRLNQAMEMILHPEREPVVRRPQPTVVFVRRDFGFSFTATSNATTGATTGTYGASW